MTIKVDSRAGSWIRLAIVVLQSLSTIDAWLCILTFAIIRRISKSLILVYTSICCDSYFMDTFMIWQLISSTRSASDSWFPSCIPVLTRDMSVQVLIQRHPSKGLTRQMSTKRRGSTMIGRSKVDIASDDDEDTPRTGRRSSVSQRSSSGRRSPSGRSSRHDFGSDSDEELDERRGSTRRGSIRPPSGRSRGDLGDDKKYV